MSFDEEVLEHGGADCRECPAYEFCEIATEPMGDACRDNLNPTRDEEAR